MKQLAILIPSMCCVATCFAGATANVFTGSLGVPRYFSGTHCYIWGDAVVTGPPISGFVHAKLFINGLLIYEYQTEDGLVMMQHMSLSVRIDSTNFANGSDLAVRMEFKDEDGVWWPTPTRNVQVKNSALLAQHPEWGIYTWGGPASIASNYIEQNFYQEWQLGAWGPVDFTNDLSGRSVVYVATYGYTDKFFAGYEWVDGQGTPFPTFVWPNGPDRYDIVGHPEWLSGAGVDNYRPPQIGLPLFGPWLQSTLPPYNPSEKPPISLAIVISCGTGVESGFTSFCFPGYTAYGEPYLRDQA